MNLTLKTVFGNRKYQSIKTMSIETFYQHKDTILNIVNNYKHENGSTAWDRAFTAHPEYVEQLRIKTREDKQKLYAFACKLKKKGEAMSNGTTKRRASLRNLALARQKKEEYRKQKEQQTQTFNKVRHCPTCGCNIEAVEMALRLTNK